jgi:hypothetical protein
MSDFRSLGAAVAASVFALCAAPARADNYNPYVTVDYLELATPTRNGEPDRPIVIGSVPNPAKSRREDKVWDWGKSQELHDLPAPPPGLAQPALPSPHANGGVSKFSANIGSHLKSAPRRAKPPKRK